MSSELYKTLLTLCSLVAEGRHEEASELLPECRRQAAGIGPAGPDLAGALTRMLKSVEDREKQLSDVIVELAALRARQEAGFKILERENKTLRNNLNQMSQAESSLCASPAMRKLLQQAERIAATPATVLITGETGSGKSFLARKIHFTSPRAQKTLISLNCAAIPEPLLESELFGIEKGVASGVDARKGFFEQASGSTLFLDEIGDMPLNCQAKILRALESGEITRVGGRRPVPVDIRLVTATHRDLERACADGSFREDLFYRLNVIHLRIPPLRERGPDILSLSRHFLRAISEQYRIGKRRFSPEVLEAFERYSWPGNLRELSHEVERAALLTGGELIRLEDLSPRLLEALAPAPAPLAGPDAKDRQGHPLQGLGGKADALTRNLSRLSRHPDLAEKIFQRLAAYTGQALFASGAKEPAAFLPASACPPPLAPQPAMEPGGGQQQAAVRERAEPAKPYEAKLSGPVEPQRPLEAPKPAEPGNLDEAAGALILRVLGECGNNKTRAAQILGLSREGLRKKMRRLGLERQARQGRPPKELSNG
ncbi:sigma-54 dependent transcriptional regulator [Desulfovibrio sp. OttesenSCG-928-G11]|nr:sigma-54 dependent transcriptional regulator [Desulfovibrio sp. OttesenSCG-928-G11]